jgi:hypothetical protein
MKAKNEEKTSIKKDSKMSIESNSKSKNNSLNKQNPSLKKKRDRSISEKVEYEQIINNIQGNNKDIYQKTYSKESFKTDKKVSNAHTNHTNGTEGHIISYKELESQEDNDNDNDYFYFYELDEKRRKNIDVKYFQIRQHFITPEMRTILCDWVMHLSSQLFFKRETFHLAISLIDISLSKLQPIKSDMLQLIGVTCLVIAAKFEEISCPNMQMYAFSTGGAYQASDIINFEQYLLSALCWNIKYPTLSLWGNLITSRWDMWISININTSPNVFKFLPMFRINDLESKIFYRMFRCIDIAVLDIESINYEFNKFICAILYLLVGVYTNSFSEDYVTNKMTKLEDLSELDQYYNLNAIIDSFLSDYVGLGLNDIAEYISEAALIFSYSRNVHTLIPFNQTNYEEYIQTQTHCEYFIQVSDIIKAKRKEIKDF